MGESGYNGEEIPRQVTTDWLAYRYRDLHRRVRELEASADKFNPAVTNERLAIMAKEVAGMKKAFYALMASIVVASLTVAFTVLITVGHS